MSESEYAAIPLSSPKPATKKRVRAPLPQPIAVEMVVCDVMPQPSRQHIVSEAHSEREYHEGK